MMYFSYSKYFLGHVEAETFLGLPCCRMSAFIAQLGLCYVTGLPLIEGYRQLHHRLPQEHGGLHVPENTLYLDIRVHRLVHSYDFFEIDALLAELALTDQELRLTNQLRAEAFMFIIKPTPKAVRIAA